MEAHHDRLSSSYVCTVIERRPADTSASILHRYPSTSNDNSDSLVAASTHPSHHLSARSRHFLVPHLPVHHHHQQQMLEARDPAGQCRLDAWQASRYELANALWWPSLMAQGLPLQVLAYYPTQSWTRFVSSFMGTGFTSSITASTSVHPQLSFDRHPAAPQRPGDPGGQCQSSTRPADVELTDNSAVRPRKGLVNWLLDSTSPSPTSTSTTTAAAASGETTLSVELDAAVRLLEQVREYRRICVYDEVDRVRRGRPPTISGDDWFSCRLCLKRYSTRGAIQLHARTHTLPCRCAVCGKAFSRPWLLQGHLRTHTGEKPFACSLCQRAFADRSNLRAHLQTHAVVKKYACSRCAKTFSRISLLAKHTDGPACPARVPYF